MGKETGATKTRDCISELTRYIHESLRGIMNTDILELKLNKSEAQIRSREQERLRIAVRRCAPGDMQARAYVKETIGKLLRDDRRLDDLKRRSIPFDRPELLSAWDQFEYLYFMEAGEFGQGVFDKMCVRYGWAKEPDFEQGGYLISDFDVEEAYRENVMNAGEDIMRAVLVQRVYEMLYGYHAADLLITDSSVDGVSGGCGGCTGEASIAGGASKSSDTIYVMYRGRHVRMQFLSFRSEKNLERVVKNLCVNDVKTALCRKTPMVVCSLLDNSRVVATRPPISDAWTFYVRRFTSCAAQDIESLICDKGNQRVITILKFLVHSEQNFVISGNQGGGKTTLLKCLVQYIDTRYTIRVAENTFEMNLNNLYPERNIQVLQEREHYTIYDVITVFKKTDCDVTILGEINEPKVAGAFIQIVQNGGRMAVSTLHHSTTDKLIDYMRNAMISEFGITDARIAERQVADSINFDVHIVRDKTGHHFIERITEIVPLYEAEGNANGALPQYECRDILLYDNTNRCYVITDTISEYARERMRAAAGAGKLMEFLSFMNTEAGRL